MRRGSSERAGLLAAIAVVCLAAIVAGIQLVRDPGGGDVKSSLRTIVVPTTLPPALPADPPMTTPPTPSVSSSPSLSKSTTGLKAVQPAQPTHLDIPAIGVSADVRGVDQVSTGPGQPPSVTPPEATEQDLLRAYMVRQYPAPGNPSQGTSYILGHTCHSVGCPAVFNKLQLLGIGETFTVTTPNGVLTYKVTKTKTYPKQDLAYKSEVFQNVQNRLVLMTCKLRSDGKSQTDNFVVFSTLVSATPN